MVKIRWIITDNIKSISLEEFNTEWNGIYGYFEITINNEIIGFYPNRELFANEEGNENILYWLSKLLKGIVQLNNGQEYVIQLLSMNLAKIVFKKSDKVIISFLNKDTNRILWSEKVMVQELYSEVLHNTERFIKEILNQNPLLLKSSMLKKLLEEEAEILQK